MDSITSRNVRDFDARSLNEFQEVSPQAGKVALIERTLATLRPSGILADVGCFTGIATVRYKSTGFEKAVGFDLSPEALSLAQKRGLECRRWVAGGSAPCPAADGEFEVVVAADVIEHVVDTDGFIEDLRRVVRSEGYLVITTPNLAFWVSRIRLLLGKVPYSFPGASPTIRSDSLVDLSHIRINTRAEWETFFTTHKLVVKQVQGWSLPIGARFARTRKVLDKALRRRPEFAFGLLFLLRKE